MAYNDKHVLIGKIITGIEIKDGADLLVDTTEGSIIAVAEGDCCSRSWVESIEHPSRGYPATVQSVEEIEMPDLGDLPDCDCVSYYGLKIVTNQGDIIIDYRNDSNGYYGGWLQW